MILRLGDKGGEANITRVVVTILISYLVGLKGCRLGIAGEAVELELEGL